MASAGRGASLGGGVLASRGLNSSSSRVGNMAPMMSLLDRTSVVETPIYSYVMEQPVLPATQVSLSLSLSLSLLSPLNDP